MVKPKYLVYLCLLREHKTGAVGEGEVLVMILTKDSLGGFPDDVIYAALLMNRTVLLPE